FSVDPQHVDRRPSARRDQLVPLFECLRIRNAGRKIIAARVRSLPLFTHGARGWDPPIGVDAGPMPGYTAARERGQIIAGGGSGSSGIQLKTTSTRPAGLLAAHLPTDL